MASTNSVKLLEITRVTPSIDSPKSFTESSLPLTFFDIYWLKFHPVERIFFYQLADSTPPFFNSVLVPKLKQSLSVVLLHFLPLAGNITWPDDHHRPFILYSPNDGVSVVVAESNADFIHLSGNQIRETIESNLYLPELPVSDSKAATLAFQITLFPNQGFSIGISSHHAAFDGKSVIMFMKSWAYICKHSQDSNNDNNPCVLPEELTPFLDRKVIQDPHGLEIIYLNNWSEAKLPGLNAENPRSLKLFQAKQSAEGFVRATFELSPEDLKKLRRKIISQLDDQAGSKEDLNDMKPMHHLSRFVISYAYTLVSIIGAKKPEKETVTIFLLIADCRARLDPPAPANYFGNCVYGLPIFTLAEAIIEANGIVFVAKKMSETIKRLENEAVINEGSKKKLEAYIKSMERQASGTAEAIAVGVAGSPKFEVYETDFGWGKPKKVEISSLKAGTISMAESRDVDGGIEIGIVLKKHELELFDSLFVNGLKDL